MAEKILQTRILNKIDTLENWSKSSLKIKQGEICLATVAASAGNGLTEPVVMMKIGTAEEKTFAELPWSFYAKASDVLETAKDATKLTTFINSVIADAGIASSEAMETLAGRVTATETAITTLNGNDETAGSVAKAIKDAIADLKLDETYVAQETGKSLVADTEIARLGAMSDGANKVEASDNGKIKIDGVDTVVYTHPEKHAIDDVTGLSNAIADAKKAGTDAAAALATHATEAGNTYETKTDAAQKLVDAKAYTDEKVGDVSWNTLKDRPFGDSAESSVLATREYLRDGNYATVASKANLVEGNSYVIEFNGERYESVCASYYSSTYGKQLLYVGNLSYISNDSKDNNDVPVAYIERDDDYAGYIVFQNNIAEFGLSEVVYECIEEKFIPNTIARSADVYTKAETDAAYAVTITETTNGLANDIAKKYTFTQNGTEIGSINLAKELVVTSGSVKEVTEAGKPYDGAVVGDKYIELVIANQDAPIYVPAKDLVDIYTAKDDATEVQVAISNTNEISATLTDAVKEKLNKAHAHTFVDSDVEDAISKKHSHTFVESELNEIKAGDVAKWNAAEQNAKDYADDQIEALGLGTMSKEAATDYVKKTEAAGYDDILTKTEAQGAYQAKGDYATAEQGSKADTAVQTVTAAADSGLKATKTDTDVTIEIDDTITWVFDCGGSGVTA